MPQHLKLPTSILVRSLTPCLSRTTNGRFSVINKKGKKTWRYFGKEQIDNAQTKKKVESVPFEKRKRRNNVEATIFQYCFHTRNNKTKYRGLIKHKMQALARCAWINVR